MLEGQKNRETRLLTYPNHKACEKYGQGLRRPIRNEKWFYFLIIEAFPKLQFLEKAHLTLHPGCSKFSSMERIKLCLILLSVIIMAVSCGSEPEPRIEDTPPPAEYAAIPAPVENTESGNTGFENANFDPGAISQELYESTKIEVQHFIEDLNKIIANGNYNAWKAALTEEYFREISSPENLQQLSEQPAMTTRKIVLKTAEDYFSYVVVPSRANSRVDDIEFISQNRVKAYTVMAREGQAQRLRLYDLELIENVWKIIN